MTDPTPSEASSTPRGSAPPAPSGAPDAERMLALVAAQQRSIEGRTGAFVPLILVAWAAAWIVSFGALWLVDAFALPVPAAVAAIVVAVGGAGALSAVLGMRSGRGRRGATTGAFAGIVYGSTWWLGIAAIVALGQALVAHGMDAELLAILYPAALLLFVGIMHVLAGAIWRAMPMIVLGAWTVVVAVAGAFFGHPTLYLVYAVAGGGGLLATALWTLLWVRAARRAVGDGDAP